jgi:hypothetical protein
MSVAAALLLASCSSGHPSSTAPPRHHTSTTPVTAPATTTTQANAAASGPLQIGAQVAVPFSADQVAAAEGPDGAIFVAPQSPDSAAPAVVWVVDGDGPAAIAEHVNAGVAALAADATNLYVASYAGVTSFNRSSGNQVRQWDLPPINTANSSNADLLSMTAAAGDVFVVISQGNTQSVYRIRPGSAAAPRLVAQGTSAVVGPNGSVYYERSDDRLVELRPSGATTVGPLLANKPNGLGGGVQFLDVVAGGQLWVSEPAGQGLDSGYSVYDEKTLQLQGSFGGTTTERIVDTAAGAFVLGFPEGPGDCPQQTSTSSNSCVFRITPVGALTDAVAVGSAFVLLGPDPAVIANNATSTQLELERIT